MLTATADLREFRVARQLTTIGLRATLSRAVGKAGDAAVDEARRVGRFKDRSGRLRKNLRRTPVRQNVDETYCDFESPETYSSFVEGGTEKHDIRPKEGHGVIGPLRPGQSRRSRSDIGTHRVALRFQMGGKTIFRRVVHHPGSKPYPFMGPGYLAAERALPLHIEIGVQIIQTQVWD